MQGASGQLKLARVRDVRFPRPFIGEAFMLLILGLVISFAASMLAYAQSRSFVVRRLRYVDAVHTIFAPFVAGIAAAVVLLPIVALLPIVGVGTALSVGFGVGAGVAAGSRDVRHSLPRY